MKIRFLSLFLVMLSLFSAQAQFEGTEVVAELVSEQKSIAPGKPFLVAIKMAHEPGWHSYWKNPGSIQLSPVVTWTLPNGFQAGELQWPTPHSGLVQKVVAYYYSDTTYLFAEITPPSDLAVGGAVEIKGKAGWQHCNETSCKEGRASLSLALPVTATPEFNEATRAELAKFRAANMPQPLKDWEVSASSTGLGYEIVFEPKGGEANSAITSAYFFSEDKQIDAQKPQPLERDGAKFILKLAKNREYEGEAKKVLPGLLFSEQGLLKTANGVAKAMEIKPEFKFRAKAVPFGRLMSIAGFALIGGLILNLMPCVFPVIGIKIFGFVNQAGEDKSKIFAHGLVYAVGVLVSFWVLSGIVFFLRERGFAWGFQLQNPWFVYVLLLIMFVFALNMFGLFEVGGTLVGVGSELTAKQGYSGSFFSGVLATVVATPCSAPFLATALGAAMTMPAIPFFVVFTCIALGLALPYVILSASPGLVNKLPRPGPWMESFKQGMSFLLFGTAGFLVWVYGGLTDGNPSNHLYAIIGLALIGIGLWIYGRWNTPSKAGRTRFIAVLLTALFAGVGVMMGYPKEDPLKWEAWSLERQQELLAEGRPVYIDFTARWCVTCQTNKLSYKSGKVVQAVEEKNIALLKADQTNNNPEISKALAGYDRAAVPVNVLLIPNEEKPLVLPEVLTTGVVLDYFAKIPAPEKK